MSLSALLQAVRDHLRTNLQWNPSECGIQPDGRPYPAFGQQYISVHPTSWAPGDSSFRGLDEIYSISCTITKRSNIAPQDRLMGELFLDNVTGLEAIARNIMLQVHRNYDLIDLANDMFEDTQKILEPLFWTGTDAIPRIEMGDWVWSDDSETIGKPAALVVEVRFSEARRLSAV